MLHFEVNARGHRHFGGGPFHLINAWFEDTAPDFGSAVERIRLQLMLDDVENMIPGGAISDQMFAQYKANLLEPPEYQFSRRNKNLTIGYTSKACLGEELQEKADPHRPARPDNQSAKIFRAFCIELIEILGGVKQVLKPNDDFDLEKLIAYISDHLTQLPATNEDLKEWAHKVEPTLQQAGALGGNGAASSTSADAMTEDQFWEIIGTINQRALDEGDEHGAASSVIDALSKLSAEEIEAFEVIMTEKLHGIDTRAHYEASDRGGDDGFLYVRCYVVGKGREFYEEVLKDPSKMPNMMQWFEMLLYAPSKAWAVVTEDDRNNFAVRTEKSYETGSNIDGWES